MNPSNGGEYLSNFGWITQSFVENNDFIGITNAMQQIDARVSVYEEAVAVDENSVTVGGAATEVITIGGDVTEIITVGNGEPGTNVIIASDKMSCGQYWYMNRGNAVPSEGGLIINVDGETEYVATAAGTGFTTDSLEMDDADGIAVGAIFEVIGSTSNDGLYQCLIHELGILAIDPNPPAYCNSVFIPELAPTVIVRSVTAVLIRGTNDDTWPVEIGINNGSIAGMQVVYNTSAPNFTTVELTEEADQLVMLNTTISAPAETEHTHTLKDTNDDEFTMNVAEQELKNKSLYDDSCQIVNASDVTNQVKFSVDGSASSELTLKATNTNSHTLSFPNLGSIGGSGATTSVKDRFIYLNQNGVPSYNSAGVIMQVNREITPTDLTGNFVSGVAGVSNATVGTVQTSGLVPSSFISIVGSATNDGLFEVLSHSANVLTIRGIGVSNTYTITDTLARVDFNAEAVTPGAQASQVSLSIIKVDDLGNLKFAGIAEDASAITYNNILTDTNTIEVENKSFVDNTTHIVASGNNTKRVKFDAAGISASTTRVVEVPDYDGTMVVASNTPTADQVLKFDGTTPVWAANGGAFDYLYNSGCDTFSAGFISQSGYTVSGTGTAFTSAMLGGIIVLPDGTNMTIAGYNNGVILQVDVSQTVSLTPYIIYYGSTIIRDNKITTSDGIYTPVISFTSGACLGNLFANGLTANRQIYFPDAAGEITMNTAAQTLTNKQLSFNNIRAENCTVYNTGTITQSGPNITGSGTAFTQAMVGGIIVYSDDTSAVVRSRSSGTAIVSSINKTVAAGSSYVIYYGDLCVTIGQDRIKANQFLVSDSGQIQYYNNTNTNTTQIQFQPPTSSNTLFVPDISSGEFVITTGTQTLTNKTLTSPVISTITNTGTLTLPTTTTTLVGRNTTDTLTNKTLTSPIINSISNTGTLTLPTSTDTLIGRNTTDTLTNKTFGQSVLPSADNTYALGSTSSQWNNIYAENVFAICSEQYHSLDV